MAFLEEVQTIVDVALYSEDEGLQIQGILALVAILLEKLIDELETLCVLLPDEKYVH